MKLTQVKGNTWVAEGLELIPFYRLEDGRCILLDTGFYREGEELERALLDVHPQTPRRALGLEASMRFFVEHLVDRGDLVLSVADRIVHYAPAKQ